MKRYLAAGIDFIISYVVSIIVYCVVISIWKSIRILTSTEIRNYSQIMVMLLFPLVFIVINIIYTVIFDKVFYGRTPGKKMAKCQVFVKCDNQALESKWILKHSLLRTLAALFYVITALYYLVYFNMPYDKILWGKYKDIGV